MPSFLRRALLGLATIVALIGSAVAAEAACEDMTSKGRSYIVCRFDLSNDSLALYWRGADGTPLGSPDRLAQELDTQGKKLIFAMNAGMYDKALGPVGLYVENGRILHNANTRNGFGNFHLKPNGVFYFGDGKAGVMETSRFLKARINARFATQSGPMLVIDGQIHPKIQPDGPSEKIRNGVGVRDGKIVIFAISAEPVSFHDFAELFRDRLGTQNALFLDGSISTLYAPPMPAIGGWTTLGPMVGVTEGP
ncbi:phosphodiester glycosidase family protein [Labrys portucalensis]|uniref:Phosphodiester glycosidase family protein n=1 Tax=Labrys neptuniae TaxID=376174 RepID=A0ABV6ZEM7_9HYPH